MTIDIGAPVDAICPRCSADALVVAAITAGEVSKIRCQECGVTYPDDDPARGDAPSERKPIVDERVEIASSPETDVPQPRRKRRQTLLDADQLPDTKRRRNETLVDFDVSLAKPDES